MWDLWVMKTSIWRCKGSATKVIWATSGWFECCGCSGWWDSALTKISVFPPGFKQFWPFWRTSCSSHTQEAIQGCFACSIWVYRSKLVQYSYHLWKNIAPLTLAWKVMKMSRNLWLLVQGFIAPWTCKVQISFGPIGNTAHWYCTFFFFSFGSASWSEVHSPQLTLARSLSARCAGSRFSFSSWFMPFS